MMARDKKFDAHKRNKGGDYSHTLSRALLREEIALLFDVQRALGNTGAVEALEREYMDIFLHQLPFASGDQILKLVGYCTFEPREKRAPKACWTAERFMLLGKVINQRIRGRLGERALDVAERERVIGLAYTNVKVTYAQIRKALDIPDSDYFVGLRYKKNEAMRDAEKKTFVELKGTHQIAKKIGMRALDVSERAPDYFDVIALALTEYKTDEDIVSYLRENTVLDMEKIDALLDLSFSGHTSLSIKAMRKINPFLAQGMRYDEACDCVGYRHHLHGGDGERQFLLPLPDIDAARNPVVLRALHQLRKVVNAIIRRYGSPTFVHIETARDLSKPFDERRQIERDQEENRGDRERIRIELENTFGLNAPKGGDILKLRLYREQNGMCAYSGKVFDAERVMTDPKYAEIDHILPYSRSLDNGFANKVLVLTDENRNKQNRIPFEYFGSDLTRWTRFESWVQANIRSLKKKQNLLRQSFTQEEANEMSERNLTDTRYITRYTAMWIAESLLFADSSIACPVVTVNGKVTSMLRGRWGLGKMKDRDKDDLHHALDAAIVAAVSRSMIKRISDYSGARELNRLKGVGDGDGKEHFPMPWASFRKEVIVHLSPDPVQAAVDEGLASFGNYTQEEVESLRPLFVSRMPNRKATGPAHQDTIRSIREGVTAVKTSLTSLSRASLDAMVGRDRDKALYRVLKERLEAFDGNAKKAFAEPIYKPTKDGSRGPLVRSIKVESVDRSGIEVRGGKAANGDMVRVDVYSRCGKFYLVPHYVYDVAKGVVKDRAMISGKDEVEWQPVDDTFTFEFSLFYNDLVKIMRGGNELFGYYKGTNRNTVSIKIQLHDGSEEISSIGVKTCGLFEKYQVDPLGDYVKVGRESPPTGRRTWAGESFT